MKLFLTAKHWQLFLLNFGIPMVAQVFFMSYMASILGSVSAGSEPDIFGMMIPFMWFLPAVLILSLGSLFGWMYSVGSHLQSKLPEGVKMPLVRFKVFLFIPLLYIIGIIAFVFWMFSHLSSIADGGPTVFIGAFAIILPLHFFSIFCILHGFWFVAKSLKTVELQKNVTFSDYAGEFALIWFYFIGVWIIQPRVNALFKVQEAETTE